jgi:hypothetical protein
MGEVPDESIDALLPGRQRETKNRKGTMKHRNLLISVLALMVAACGAAPPLELEDEPFRDGENDYAIRYPGGWQHVYVERIGGEVFYRRGEPIEDIVATRAVAEVPVVVVIASPLDDIPHVSLDGVQDSRTMLQAFLAWLGDVQGGKIGRTRTLTVAGQPAAAADIRWPALLVPDTTVAGRAVAVYLGERALFIEAAGRAENWKKFEPTFEAMVQSLTLD